MKNAETNLDFYGFGADHRRQGTGCRRETCHASVGLYVRRLKESRFTLVRRLLFSGDWSEGGRNFRRVYLAVRL